MSEEEICRAGRAGILPPDDARLPAALEQRAANGKVNAELSFLRKDGTRFEAEVSSVILSGGQSRAFVVVRDISGRKRAEEALLRNEKLASVGRMAASVAHEINNPLAAVTNAIFLAQRVQGLPDEAGTYLETADTELKRVAHVTRQSLGFYRELATPVRIPANAVAQSAIDLMKSGIKAKRAVVRTQWDKEVHVVAVEGELRQVLSNLLANSLDAIDEEGTITVRLSTVSTGSRVRITVADNGKGISRASREHIFEPFFTTKGSIGTGLGLWISNQIIQKHGGSIRLRSSTEGTHRETLFSILLPADPMNTTDPRLAR